MGGVGEIVQQVDYKKGHFMDHIHFAWSKRTKAKFEIIVRFMAFHC